MCVYVNVFIYMNVFHVYVKVFLSLEMVVHGHSFCVLSVFTFRFILFFLTFENYSRLLCVSECFTCMCI